MSGVAGGAAGATDLMDMAEDSESAHGALPIDEQQDAGAAVGAGAGSSAGAGAGAAAAEGAGTETDMMDVSINSPGLALLGGAFGISPNPRALSATFGADRMLVR